MTWLDAAGVRPDEDASEVSLLTQRLIVDGYSEERIRKILGSNALRVLCDGGGRRTETTNPNTSIENSLRCLREFWESHAEARHLHRTKQPAVHEVPIFWGSAGERRRISCSD